MSIDLRRRVAVPIALALVSILGACQTAGLGLADLAKEPPLSYSVFVTGGAFITPGP